MSDRRLISALAAAIAGANDHSVRCETEGCDYTVYAASPERAQAIYAEHLRTDPRHTGGEWTDRDVQERHGLERIE